MHPLVRDLYRRVILIGRDYPHADGISYVRREWKKALRNPENCPSWYQSNSTEEVKEKELRKAIAKGRYVLREMIGVIQLKKYRSLKRMYGEEYSSSQDTDRLLASIRSSDLPKT